MSKKNHPAFANAVVEKDVENAYRQNISRVRPAAIWESKYNTDGIARWSTVRLLLEAKFDLNLTERMAACTVLGQVLIYLKKFERSGDPLPNVIMVGDRNECFVLATSAVSSFLNTPINWDVPASSGSPELLRALVAGVNILPFVHEVDTKFSFTALCEQIEVLSSGMQTTVRASETNLAALFTHWKNRVYKHGKTKLSAVEEVDIFLSCLFQPEDIYLHPTKKGLLILPTHPNGIIVDAEQYRAFFGHFAQGYRPSEVARFMAMRDRLIEDDARRRQGAFFTPRLWVEEAHRELDRVLGTNWRKDCVVWDCASGTGNLTRDKDDWGCLLSSTLETADVNAMIQHGWGGHHVFQYDFLNDEGPLSGKLPAAVQAVLRLEAAKGKRLVWLMNPPYGTAGDAGAKGTSKAGIATTGVNKAMKEAALGAPSQQLYAQFMFQCQKMADMYGFEQHTVATFSMIKFMSSGSYRPFRRWWYSTHEYKGGFMFQASHFADVSGAWGVSFTVWNSDGHTNGDHTLPIRITDEQNFEVVTTNIKQIYSSDDREASGWVKPARGMSVDLPQFKSGLSLRSDGGVAVGIEGHLFYMRSSANNVMESGTQTCLVSGLYAAAHGFSVLPSNWRRAVALYAARKLVTDNWIIHEDEYLAPDESEPGYEQWVNDCHVFALLDTKNNCTAMRNVLYKEKLWQIHNHWFWIPRAAALTALDTNQTHIIYKDAKAHPHEPYFASLLVQGLPLSQDAQGVLTALTDLWRQSLPFREAFYAGRAITEDAPDLHLHAWDAGVYQLKHLWTTFFPEEWAGVKAQHKALAERLRPGVYTYGFLK
jgi:hypothetical protein